MSKIDANLLFSSGHFELSLSLSDIQKPKYGHGDLSHRSPVPPTPVIPIERDIQMESSELLISAPITPPVTDRLVVTPEE